MLSKQQKWSDAQQAHRQTRELAGAKRATVHRVAEHAYLCITLLIQPLITTAPAARPVVKTVPKNAPDAAYTPCSRPLSAPVPHVHVQTCGQYTKTQPNIGRASRPQPNSCSPDHRTLNFKARHGSGTTCCPTHHRCWGRQATPTVIRS